MIKRFTTTILTILFAAALAVPASAQMTDDQIITYTKDGLASGKTSDVIAKELLAKGATMEQIKKLQSNSKGVTGMNSFNEALKATGGQERIYSAQFKVIPNYGRSDAAAKVYPVTMEFAKQYDNTGSVSGLPYLEYEFATEMDADYTSVCSVGETSL